MKSYLKIGAYLIFLMIIVIVLVEVFLTLTNFPLQKTYFEYEPDMGYRTIPYKNNSNYFGFNDKDYPLAKPKDVYRILVLGDSFNWIGGRQNNYVRFLQEKFSKEEPNSKIEVINVGYIGTHTGEQLEALKKYAIQYHPDLVVLGFFAGNDFIEGDPERVKVIVNGIEMNVRKGKYLELRNFPIVLKSRFLMFLTQKLKRKIAIPRDGKQGTFRKEAFLMIEKSRMNFYSKKNITAGKFSKNINFIFLKIKEMKDFLERKKIRFFVFIFPDQFTVDQNLSDEILETFFLKAESYNLEYAQDILKEYLTREEIPFYDLTPRFKEKQKIKNLFLLNDTHWNVTGARTAANQLYYALKPIVREELVKNQVN